MLCLLLSAGTVRAEERAVEIFGGRKISVSVPKGWRFGESQDPKTGLQTLEWLDPSGEIQLDVTFIPDPRGRLSTREGLEAELRKVGDFYLEGAVEREMKITHLDTPEGIGGYASFTDRSLVGKTIPQGERLVSTTGIRSRKGAYLIFTLLSNSRDSEPYRQALEIVRSGMKDAGGPAASGTSASTQIRLTLPWVPWVLTVPGERTTVRERKVNPDGTSGYFFLTNESTGLNVSFFIEPARKCASSRECRDMIQKAGFGNLGKVERISAFEIGDVSTVECFLPESRGLAVSQQHFFAEFVVKGYWVDMHVSKVLYTPEDRELFQQLVKGISFQPKGSLN